MPVTLNDVLGCKNLPSLPGVAVEILALTRDPNVPLDKIARVIQNDAALTAKVLRTVNSSFYGLSQRCATLNRAIGFLGIKTVKSLVLGFCLVDTTRSVEAGGFDLSAYWGRCIYAATAARTLSGATGATDPDEAFTACLFQDIGMLAMYAALNAEYDAVVAQAPKDHARLRHAERERFGFDHTEVGAALAERWNLPPQHIESIRCPDHPDEASEAFRELVRIVATSVLAAEAASSDDPARPAAQLLLKAKGWFDLSRESTEELLHKVGDAARQLAKEFDKDLGPRPDVTRIMAEANELLLETNLEVQQEAAELELAALTDGLTGLGNRKRYDQALARGLSDARGSGRPLSLLFIDADRFKSVNDRFGHDAGDAVLKELARRLKASAPPGAIVCRYGGEEFAVIMPGLEGEAAYEAGERVRAGVADGPFDLRATGAGVDLIPVTVSVGVSSFDPSLPGSETISAEQLTKWADTAVYAAKQGGRNRVETARDDPRGATRAVASVPAPGTPRTARVLLVEDDPLAGRLMATLLGKRQDVVATLVSSGEEALRHLNGQTPPNLVITDLSLGQMSGLQLIACAKSDPKTRALPFVVLTASRDPGVRRECLDAGAALFLNKDSIVTELNATLSRILALAA